MKRPYLQCKQQPYINQEPDEQQIFCPPPPPPPKKLPALIYYGIIIVIEVKNPMFVKFAMHALPFTETSCLPGSSRL